MVRKTKLDLTFDKATVEVLKRLAAQHYDDNLSMAARIAVRKHAASLGIYPPDKAPENREVQP